MLAEKSMLCPLCRMYLICTYIDRSMSRANGESHVTKYWTKIQNVINF
jgi:hypothetical protein